TRLLRRLKALVRAAFPTYDYLPPRRYRVERMVGDRAELRIVKKASGFPNILPVSLSAAPGLAAELAPGAVVAVQFLEGDPSLPLVTLYPPKGDPGWLPVAVAVDASATITIGAQAPALNLGSAAHAVIREGDTVQISPGNGGGVVAGVISFSGPSIP